MNETKAYNLKGALANRNDMFAFEKALISLFRMECIITVANNEIDPKGFNLKQVPGRLYKIFDPVFTEEKKQLYLLLFFHPPDPDAIWSHMIAVRHETCDVEGTEYLFIRGYRVGHTLEGEGVIVVVEAQVKGGCHYFDDSGHIGGDGVGRWYAVLCPSEAEWELVDDLKAEEARRRKFLPETVWELKENTDEVDTSELF